MYLRDHARAGSRGPARRRRRAARPGRRAHPDAAMPGSHAPAARAAGAARPPSAGPRPGAVRDVDRLRDWDARAAVSPYGVRCAGRLVAGPGPRGGRRASSASTRRVANSIDGTSAPRLRGRVRASSRAMLGVDLSRLARGGHPLDHRASSASSTLDDAWSTGISIMPQKKNPDIAELARGKAGPADRQPDRPAGDAQGRCRSRTTATCRRTRSRSSTPSTAGAAAAGVRRAWSRP